MHPTRVNRRVSENGKWSAFGSNSYSKEELVAELGAAFLCAEAGILSRTVDNSVAYIQGWIERLKSDSRLIIEASSKAQHATEFILSKLQTGPPAETQN
jgi:antirestriction protein ArdC